MCLHLPESIATKITRCFVFVSSLLICFPLAITSRHGDEWRTESWKIRPGEMFTRSRSCARSGGLSLWLSVFSVHTDLEYAFCLLSGPVIWTRKPLWNTIKYHRKVNSLSWRPRIPQTRFVWLSWVNPTYLYPCCFQMLIAHLMSKVRLTWNRNKREFGITLSVNQSSKDIFSLYTSNL